MMKISIKYLVLSILVIFAFAYYILPTTNYQLPPAFAQVPPECATPTGSDPARVINGLVSTPDLQTGSQLYTSLGKCAKDPKTVFVPFKIPTYEDLKSLYFTQSKATKCPPSCTVPSSISSATSFSGDKVYWVNGDLGVTGTPTGTGTQVIFVEGKLNFSANYTYGSTNADRGTVFVVKGDVNLTPSSALTRIDAVIISGRTICTASPDFLLDCPPSGFVTVSPANQLQIFGSLISLDPTKPIKFRRSLGDANNTTAAEKINHQPKYLVILRNLFSQTLQKWSEILGPVSLSTPPPAPPPPPPPPSPSPSPGCTTIVIGPSIVIGPLLCI